MSIEKIYKKGKIYKKQDIPNGPVFISKLPNNLVIRISGLAGSGKGTLSKRLKENLDILYIESSFILRACSYIYLDLGLELSPENTKKVFELMNVGVQDDLILIKYKDKVLQKSDLKNDQIDRVVAIYAGDHYVRLAYYEKIISFIFNLDKACILDGRGAETPYLQEIKEKGSNIIRISLYTNDEVGYKRYQQESIDKNLERTWDDYNESVLLRNQKDVETSYKENLPLSVDESHVVDTSYMTPDEVLATVLMIINRNI